MNFITEQTIPNLIVLMDDFAGTRNWKGREQIHTGGVKIAKYI